MRITLWSVVIPLAKSYKIFVSYSHKDSVMMSKLKTHLSPLSRTDNVDIWYDGKISAGSELSDEIFENLKQSEIILLLISPAYVESNFCYEKEMLSAIHRAQNNECLVIPVIIKPTLLIDELPFGSLMRVPKDGKPISAFKPTDSGYADAAQRINQAIEVWKNQMSSKNQSTANSQRQALRPPKKRRARVCIQLYKEGVLTACPVNQATVDALPTYLDRTVKFIRMMDVALEYAINKYKQQHLMKKKRKNWRLIEFRQFLFTLSSYIKIYLLGGSGVRVHFRCLKDGAYYGIMAVDDDEQLAVKINWAKELTRMPSRSGMIYHSNRLKAPLIKSYNQSYHIQATHDDKWEEYLTYALIGLNEGNPAPLSFGISINKTIANAESAILNLIAYTQFAEHITQYLTRYIASCKQIDSSFRLTNIISDYNLN